MALSPLIHPDDTLAFANETVWSYALDPLSGRQVHQPRVPPPQYTLRCFPLARVVKLFHLHAQFEPEAPQLEDAAYRSALRRLLQRNARRPSPPSARLIFPGYANLRTFSAAHEALLKAQLGGAWHSYVQRGHWRMVFPFTRGASAAEAARLLAAVNANRAPVVHVFVFPGLTINHAIVLFEATETAGKILFRAYDPNSPETILVLDFNRDDRTFYFPPTAYFIGGKVNAYEVYRSLFF